MTRREGALLLYAPLNEARRPAVERLIELHSPLVLITENASEQSLPRWARGRFAKILPACRRDPAEFLARLAREVPGTIAGVVTLSETGVFFCAVLAEALKLPFTTPELAINVRDKARMRSLFRDNQLPTVPFATASGLDEARRIAAAIGYPVVIKPMLAGGSLFVRTIQDERELSDCFDSYMHGGIAVVAGDPLVEDTFQRGAAPRLLIEKRIDGCTLFDTLLPLPVGEISVEGFVLDGQCHVFGMHDKPLPENGPHFEEVLWSTPTRVPPALQDQLQALAQRTVSALGHRNGFFHMEARTTAAGPVLIEIAGRMGGGPIYRSILESTGIDMIQVMHDAACGARLDPRSLLASRAVPVVTIGVFSPAGQLRAIEGLDEVREHPDVLEVAVYEPPGTFIRRAPRSDHCTLHVMVKGATHRAAEEVCLWAQRKLRFVVDGSEQRYQEAL